MIFNDAVFNVIELFKVLAISESLDTSLENSVRREVFKLSKVFALRLSLPIKLENIPTAAIGMLVGSDIRGELE